MLLFFSGDMKRKAKQDAPNSIWAQKNAKYFFVLYLQTV